MPPTDFQSIFLDVLIQTDEVLWEAYDLSVSADSTGGKTNLRFPRYRNGEIRVSEQEARFAFVSRLATTPLLYTVSAPTGQVYQFKGKVIERSGETDVAVHNPSFELLYNVEFKAKGITEDRLDRAHIQKDLKKLLEEDFDGCWFHLLEGIDNSNLNKFWNVFKLDLGSVAQSSMTKVKPKKLLLHVCALREKISIQRLIDVTPEQIDVMWLSGIGPIDYSLSRGVLLATETSGWRIHRKA